MADATSSSQWDPQPLNTMTTHTGDSHTCARLAGTYLVGWPWRAGALQHPPGQARAPPGASGEPSTPVRGRCCRLRRGGCGAAAGPAPGAYPTSLFTVVLHVRSKTRLPHSQVCAFGARDKASALSGSATRHQWGSTGPPVPVTSTMVPKALSVPTTVPLWLTRPSQCGPLNPPPSTGHPWVQQGASEEDKGEQKQGRGMQLLGQGAPPCPRGSRGACLHVWD